MSPYLVGALVVVTVLLIAETAGALWVIRRMQRRITKLEKKYERLEQTAGTHVLSGLPTVDFTRNQLRDFLSGLLHWPEQAA